MEQPFTVLDLFQTSGCTSFVLDPDLPVQLGHVEVAEAVGVGEDEGGAVFEAADKVEGSYARLTLATSPVQMAVCAFFTSGFPDS